MTQEDWICVFGVTNWRFIYTPHSVHLVLLASRSIFRDRGVVCVKFAYLTACANARVLCFFFFSFFLCLPHVSRPPSLSPSVAFVFFDRSF